MEIEHGLTAFVILFREGLEVLFIVLSIYAITKKLTPIFLGCLVGALVNIGLGILFSEFIQSKIVENSLMLGAAALMLYVARGLLLWQFTGAKKKLRLEESARVVANNPTALFMLSAFFVGREAFEVLVFLQALSLRAGGFSISILFGISIAIVFLVVVYLFFNHLVNRLPMKLIFVISSVWLIVQAGLIVWEVMS